MHKYMGIVRSLVVIEECQKAVWSGSEMMTGSTMGNASNLKNLIQGWYV